MTMTRSYDPRSFGRGVAGELERLQGQVELSWPKEARSLAALAGGDVSRIAELGSGPGFYTSRLLELFPRAAVTCVDADSLLLSEARKNLAAVSARIQFVEAAAEHTTLSDGVFDLAVARLLFQHLADPGQVAREMFRILRPGGWAAVIDADDDLALLIDPEPPGFRELMGGFARAQAERGGDRRVGRRLPRILRGAGFVDGRFEIIALHSDELGKAAFASQLDPGLMRPLVAAGVLTQEQLGAVEEGMRSLLADEKTILLMSRVFAAGQKPL